MCIPFILIDLRRALRQRLLRVLLQVPLRVPLPVLLTVMLNALLLASGSLSAAEPEAPAGAVVVIGGALKSDNDEVWGRVVQLAGGAGARFVVFATSAGNPDRSAAEIIDALQRRGAVAEHIRVAPRIAGIDLAAGVRDPVWINKVQAARGVFFSGGDQVRLLDTLLPGGERSPLLDAVRALLQRGGVVAGTSAGAAVMSEVVFRELPDVLKAMQAPLREGIDIGRGFALVPPQVIVDQHFLKRGRVGRLLPLLLHSGRTLGLGVEENTAAVVRGQDVEVIGARGVLVLDTAAASTDRAAGAFNVAGVKLSYLDRGDQFNLSTRRITPSARKQAGTQLNPNAAGFRGYFSGAMFYADILGDFTIVNAMARLVDSNQAEATGLAFNARPGPGDAQPQLGFEWRLSIGAGTRAWAGNPGDDYSVAEVLLSVAPVRLARPLYTPWNPGPN